MGSPDVVIARAAAATHNLIRRSTLLQLGLTERQIDGRVKAGMLARLFPGVYAVGGGRLTFEQRSLAAAWATGGAASHLCAAALFGFRRIEPGPVEVTIPHNRRACLPGVVVHRLDLPPNDLTSFRDIPVTRPARVLLDIAGAVEPKILAGAVDHCLVKRLTSLPALGLLLDQVGGRGKRGFGSLRTIVDQRLAGQKPTESALEDDLFELIEQTALPVPERQVKVRLPSGSTVRFDGGYGQLQLGMEADSREHHVALSDRERDVARDALCRSIGWEVLRFTTEDIRSRPNQVIQRIDAEVRERCRPGRLGI